jgi:tellurite resistance protein
MHEQNLAILKGLVCVAWADGRVTSAESELLEGLLQAYAATPSETLEVRKFAESPRVLTDVPIHDLSYNDRRVLLSQAVLLGFVDGELHEKERVLIDELCHVLRVPSIEARGIIDAASEQASKLLPLLNR